MYHPSQVGTIANAHEKDLMKMARRTNNKRNYRQFRNIRKNISVLLASLKA